MAHKLIQTLVHVGPKIEQATGMVAERNSDFKALKLALSIGL